MATPAKGRRPASISPRSDAMTDAVESGAGLPEVVRAASRALDASLVLLDRAGAVLAVAARSPADERALAGGGAGVESLELRVGDEPVGALRLRAARGRARRRRAPAARRDAGRLRGRARAGARARLGGGGRRLPARAPGAPARRPRRDRRARPPRSASTSRAGGDGARRPRPRPRGRRGRLAPARPRRRRARRARRARPGASPRCARPPSPPGAEVVVLAPGRRGRGRRARRGRGARSRAPGRAAGPHLRARPQPRRRGPGRAATAPATRRCWPPTSPRATPERPVLAFEETGAYRLLLSAMSEDPAELQRFYAETVEPLVAYDEQYETDLVRRSRRSSTPTATSRAPRSGCSPTATPSATASSGCASCPASTWARPTAARSCRSGLKAMRVLGVAHRGGPATERARGRARPAADLLTLRRAAVRQLWRRDRPSGQSGPSSRRSGRSPARGTTGSAPICRCRAHDAVAPHPIASRARAPGGGGRRPRGRAADRDRRRRPELLGARREGLARPPACRPLRHRRPDERPIRRRRRRRACPHWAGCWAAGRAAPPSSCPAPAPARSSAAAPAPRRRRRRRRHRRPGPAGRPGRRVGERRRDTGVGTKLVRAADADGDGVPDQVELRRGMNPESSDSDGDGLPDGWEVREGTAPTTADASADDDDDGLSNRGEYAVKTTPCRRTRTTTAAATGPAIRTATGSATRSRRASRA